MHRLMTVNIPFATHDKTALMNQNDYQNYMTALKKLPAIGYHQRDVSSLTFWVEYVPSPLIDTGGWNL